MTPYLVCRCDIPVPSSASVTILAPILHSPFPPTDRDRDRDREIPGETDEKSTEEELGRATSFLSLAYNETNVVQTTSFGI
ncbi:hypothetical protein M5689_006590 [Euphorbia peplus]|nr:hypothetical protein M5689_006590 [Euphorbia peplus]